MMSDEKGTEELKYWRQRKEAEGTLNNSHYEYFYTTHFGLDHQYYSGKKILDIGCGPRGSLEWANMTALRVGLDPLANLYKELGTDKHKMQYVHSGSETIPFPDGHFDVVCSFNSLDHVDDLDKTISEIKRVTKPGGYFLLLTEVNHKPTACEPITLTWDTPPLFTDEFEIVREKQLEETIKGNMYTSIKDNVPYNHADKKERYGILSVMFKRKGAAGNAAPATRKLPNVSVIVPFYNAAGTLSPCLKSLSELDYPKELLELIVVDNGSTDGSVAVARQFGVKILSETSTQSSYAARNKGIKESTGEFIAFTDADCIVTPGWLRMLMAEAEDKSVGCFAGEIEAYKPENLIEKFSDRRGFLRQKGTLSNTYMPYTQTANSVYRREVFEKVGLFRPEMTSGGDADIAWRMQKQLGLKIKFIPEALVYHHHRTTLRALYKQFQKYETGKRSWLTYYPDYPSPTVEQRRTELATFWKKAKDSFAGNLKRYLKSEIDSVEFVAPWLWVLIGYATYSASKKISNMESNKQAKPLNSPVLQNEGACECPVCGNTFPAFLPFGMKSDQPPLPNAQCPSCKCLARHRLIWLYFRDKTDLLSKPLRMLHVAPDPQISQHLLKIQTIDYISADLDSPRAMLKMDLTNIQYPDNSFDVVYASHVLEHILDDVKAMKEIYRVLKPYGWAILQVPIKGKITIEDPSITDPKERERLFGQFDHVRQYGHDGVYKQRLESAGFIVKADPYVKTLGPELIKKYGLMASEDIYYCSKQ